MGKKTSLYLTDSVLARVEADGGKLPDILIAGLDSREAERASNVSRVCAETRTQAGTDPLPPADITDAMAAQADGEKLAEALMARAAAGDPGAREAIGMLVPSHPLGLPPRCPSVHPLTEARCVLKPHADTVEHQDAYFCRWPANGPELPGEPMVTDEGQIHAVAARLAEPTTAEKMLAEEGRLTCPHRNWGRFCVRCDALISETGYPVPG
jgi:hypothetical protein